VPLKPVTVVLAADGAPYGAHWMKSIEPSVNVPEARRDYPAAESAFRSAVSSPNLGFTRVNRELARVLLAEGRPRDAVPVLRAALRGSLEGSNYYVTRAELEGLLARAESASTPR